MVEKFQRTAEQVAQIEALPPLGSEELRQAIRDHGATLQAEVLVFLLREAAQKKMHALVDACTIALVTLESKYAPKAIVRRAGLKYGLYDPEHQKKLWEESELRMWRKIMRDRTTNYLWEVRFGAALEQVAETYAQRLRNAIEHKRLKEGNFPEQVEADPDTFASKGEPEEEVLRTIGKEHFRARLAMVIDLLQERHQRVATLCYLEELSQAEAARRSGIHPRTVSNDMKVIKEILRQDPILAACADDLDFLFAEDDGIGDPSGWDPDGPKPDGGA